MAHHADIFQDIDSNYVKVQLTEMLGKIDIFTIVVRDFIKY